jgi:hypothetical protein
MLYASAGGTPAVRVRDAVAEACIAATWNFGVQVGVDVLALTGIGVGARLAFTGGRMAARSLGKKTVEWSLGRERQQQGYKVIGAAAGAFYAEQILDGHTVAATIGARNSGDWKEMVGRWVPGFASHYAWKDREDACSRL